MRRSFVSHIRIGRFIVVCVLTVVAFSILVNLGLWQLSRAEEKSEIEQQVNLREQYPAISLQQLSSQMVANPVGIRVQFNAQPIKGRYLLLDNQSFEGKVGYLALQLIRSESGKMVLVERGFVAAPALRTDLPDVDWLEQPLALHGRLYRKSANPLSHNLLLEPGSVSRIQNLNFEQLEQHWQLSIEPYVIQPISDSWPYAQPWQPVSMNSEKHRGYAVQWFAMAAALVVLSGLLLLRTIRKGATDD